MQKLTHATTKTTYFDETRKPNGTLTKTPRKIVVVWSFDEDTNELKYGASIYRFSHDENPCEKFWDKRAHRQTAIERYERFPVFFEAVKNSAKFPAFYTQNDINVINGIGKKKLGTRSPPNRIRSERLKVSRDMISTPRNLGDFLCTFSFLELEHYIRHQLYSQGVQAKIKLRRTNH